VNEDIYTLQQDALRRVNEMRSRARANLASEPKRENKPPDKSKKEAPLPLDESKKLKGFPLFSFIKDQEQLLVLLLVVLLIGEDFDEGLVLALLYICL